MPRKMRDPRFREQQWEDRYAPHVEPINRYVDQLAERPGRLRPPYVAPMYFGVRSRVLIVSRDPGPKAGGTKGSGFLCVENDDSSAERMYDFVTEAGLDVRDMLPWNAYPWYINADPTREQLQDGVETLGHVLRLAPDVQAVVYCGTTAWRAGRLFKKANANVLEQRGIQSFEMYHTSRQALFTPDPEERTRREQLIRDTLRRVASIVQPTEPVSDSLGVAKA